MVQSLQDGFGALLLCSPQLIGAIVATVVIVKLLRRHQGARTMGFDGWMREAASSNSSIESPFPADPTSVLGKLVFWFVFIASHVMATNAPRDKAGLDGPLAADRYPRLCSRC